jgi:hypothetical protein
MLTMRRPTVRRSIAFYVLVIALTLTAAMLLLSGCDYGKGHRQAGGHTRGGDGGGGVVSAAGRVGELRIDESTPADIRRSAGAPAFAGRGEASANFVDILPWYEALAYACARNRSQGAGVDPGGARPTHTWCRTIYFVNPKTGRLAGFWTASSKFRTVKGSRAGMPQKEADRLEGAHPYIHALTGIDRHTPTAALFIENSGCKPGANLNASPCLGGHVRGIILEGRRHPVGLLEDGIPW